MSQSDTLAVEAELALGRSERSVGTRQRILEAAASAFAELGYTAASVDEVAERAGVTKATVYYHFSNKESIYAAVATEIARSYNELVRLLSTSEGRTPTEKLVDLVCSFVHSVLDPRTKRMHYERYVQLSDSTKRILRDAQHYYADAITQQLELAQATGDVYPGDAKLMALSVFEGAARVAVWYNPAGRVSPDDAHPVICGMFLRAILTPAGLARVADAQGGIRHTGVEPDRKANRDGVGRPVE